MEELTFNTIEGIVKAVKRVYEDMVYYDCYLMDEDGKGGTYIGEADGETEEELKVEINSLL